MNEFHHQTVILQDAAVDLLTMPDLEIPGGTEGQGGQIARRDPQIQRLSLELAGEVEGLIAQGDLPRPSLRIFPPALEHMEPGPGRDAQRRVRRKLPAQFLMDQTAPV